MSNVTPQEQRLVFAGDRVEALRPRARLRVVPALLRRARLTERSEGGGIAYFLHDEASFLLQDFYNKELAENLMLHLLVADVDAWHARVASAGLAQRYGVKVSEIAQQPWRMRDFALWDPSGVLWRIAQNVQHPLGVPGTLHE